MAKRKGPAGRKTKTARARKKTARAAKRAGASRKRTAARKKTSRARAAKKSVSRKRAAAGRSTAARSVKRPLKKTRPSSRGTTPRRAAGSTRFSAPSPTPSPATKPRPAARRGMGRIESVPPPAPPVVTSEPPKDIVPAFETARGTSASTGDVEGEEEEDESFELGAPSSLMPGRRAGRAGAVATPEDEFAEEVGADGGLRAGDVDVRLDEASMVGDETPGGDNPTPDQDVVDLIGRSLGVEYEDTEELKGADKIAARDRRRWELDPASSEDYRNRSKTKTR